MHFVSNLSLMSKSYTRQVIPATDRKLVPYFNTHGLKLQKLSSNMLGNQEQDANKTC